MPRRTQEKVEGPNSQTLQYPDKQSPRVKNKQAPLVATPISKKALEYAGPSFNHSPAPAKLPPPPFLSKLVTQNSPSNSSWKHGLNPEESSDRLFNAESAIDLQHDGSIGRPPSSGHALEGTKTEHKEAKTVACDSRNPAIISHWTVLGESCEPGQLVMPSTPPAQKVVDQAHQKKSNPWTIEKKEIPQAQVSTSNGQSSLQSTASTRKSLSHDPRRKKSKANKPSSTAESVPRAILKRPTSVSAVQSPLADTHSRPPQGTRIKSESPYTPLHRQVPISKFCSLNDEEALSNAQAQAQEEESLRLQTSQLMSLLEIRPENERSSQDTEGRSEGNESTSKDGIEADLRRLLRLGA